MDIYPTKNTIEILQTFALLQDLDNYYPDFSHWFQNTALPGVVTGEDFCLVAREGHQLVGVVLGKRGQEAKLRCVRVHPDAQSSGLGIRMIDRSLDLLETTTPHCSVSEEMLHAYARPFVNRYGFKLSQVDKGRYRPGKLEYLFN